VVFGRHQFLGCGGVNLMGERIIIIMTGAEALLGASKEAGLKVNAGKTTCFFKLCSGAKFNL
jgi:hypothetical protein